MTEIKCFLHVAGFHNPIKTAVINVKNGATDREIKEAAEDELYKDFRIEYEDIRENQQLKSEFKQLSRQTLEVNGLKYRRSDLMRLHGLTSNQYLYLRSQCGHSMIEIYQHGRQLFKRNNNKMEVARYD